MSTRIDAADLAKSVKGLLDKFGKSAENVLAEAVVDTAKVLVKELKKGGDFGGTGEYNSTWTYKMESKRLYATARVYNKDNYRLTHLLEFGHAKQNGGRTKAFPHIAPANDRVEEIFVEKFTDALAEELTR